MQILRTEKQKDNLAKFFWDDAKIALAALIVGPVARPEIAQTINDMIRPTLLVPRLAKKFPVAQRPRGKKCIQVCDQRAFSACGSQPVHGTV